MRGLFTNTGVFLAGCFLLLAIRIDSGFAEASSSDAPLFSMDLVNQAAGDSTLSRLDLYLKITNSQLQFIKAKGEGFEANYEYSIAVFDDTGQRVDGKILKEQVKAGSLDEAHSTRTYKITKVTFDLPPNPYRVTVGLQDMETLHTARQESGIVLRDYSGNALSTSDILFLDGYTKDENGNFTFRPRVSSIKHADSKLYAYLEVYNVTAADSFDVQYDFVSPEKVTYLHRHYVSASEGKVTRNFIQIDGDSLSHGKYMMNLQVSYKGDTVSVKRPLDWFLEGIPSSITSLDQAIEVLKYIAPGKVYKKLRKTSPKQKHQAFIDFWKERDPTPDTPENELLEEYYQRIQYANENFPGFKKEGWRTDRGWVYVMLGAPDLIERNPFNQRFAPLPGRTIKAMQLWVYYRYNREFLFFDENGFGDYRLENPETLYEILK